MDGEVLNDELRWLGREDEDETDRMKKQDIIPLDARKMHDEMSDLWFKQEGEGGREMVTADEERASIGYKATNGSNFG